MRKAELYILYELFHSKRSVWELLASSDCLLKEFIEAISSLHRDGFIAVDEEGFSLTEKGKRTVDKAAAYFRWRICEACNGKSLLFDGKFNDLLHEFKRIAEAPPDLSPSLFQGYIREEAVVSRVALMHSKGDLRKDFVLIGDDDLLSVALALRRLPSRICVLDIDARIGEFLKLSQEYKFEIEFYTYDVAEPLPSTLLGSFDVFSSEPLETMSGLKAFIRRGVGCLRENGSGYFGLTTAEASYTKWVAIEKMLIRMNCVITDIIKGFSRYPMHYNTVNYEAFTDILDFPAGGNLRTDWYKSAIFRFEALGKPKHARYPNKKIIVKYIDEEEDITHPSISSRLCKNFWK
jgi:predicted methyltransferase